MDLSESITEKLKNKQSIVLVGGASSGKTHFVLNKLVPALKRNGFKVVYIKECDDEFDIPSGTDIVIVDEVETFVDREFLEARHLEESPYYDDAYIKQVNNWISKLSKIKQPTLYIITRNEKAEIQNLKEKMHNTDWDRPVKVIDFKREYA